jgi:hypothetical protein
MHAVYWRRLINWRRFYNYLVRESDTIPDKQRTATRCTETWKRRN